MEITQSCFIPSNNVSRKQYIFVEIKDNYKIATKKCDTINDAIKIVKIQYPNAVYMDEIDYNEFQSTINTYEPGAIYVVGDSDQYTFRVVQIKSEPFMIVMSTNSIQELHKFELVINQL